MTTHQPSNTLSSMPQSLNTRKKVSFFHSISAFSLQSHVLFPCLPLLLTFQLTFHTTICNSQSSFFFQLSPLQCFQHRFPSASHLHPSTPFNTFPLFFHFLFFSLFLPYGRRQRGHSVCSGQRPRPQWLSPLPPPQPPHHAPPLSQLLHVSLPHRLQIWTHHNRSGCFIRQGNHAQLPTFRRCC